MHSNMIVDSCSKHPRYEAKAKPRSMCVACWSMWEAKKEAELAAEAARVQLEIEENEVSTFRYVPARRRR